MIITSLVVIGVFTDGILELFNALCHADDFLFEGSLLGLEVTELLVETD